jgi:HK97 family phage prohead protease
METIQLKSLNKGAVVDVDTTKQIVVGYFAKFNDEPDSDGDVIAPGAFTKTLAMNGPNSGNRIWHLWNHSFSEPINKPYFLAEDAAGLRFETKFPDTTVGRDKLILYQEKAITEHSFGYNVIYNEAKQTHNLLTELRMWEGSSVLWGANKNSQTVGMKSEDFILKTNILESLLRNGTLSDATFEMIEKLLKDIQAIFKGTGEPEQKTEPEKTATSLTEAEIKLLFYSNLLKK